MRKINVGLLGCGTVGTGVAKILLGKKDLLKARAGVEIVLRRVADLDMQTDRGICFDPGVFISDGNLVVEDPEIDIVIEMIGGDGIAREMIVKAIENGKSVVTANKALLATHGNELFAAATAGNVDLAYEASVGGCMPIIKTLRESLVGNDISALTGILNGTCNYILTKITEEGATFEAALQEAQKNGFAEADPTLDVEGFDTAHKLAILMSISYGMKINFTDIYIEGISKITPLDIEFARQFGYRIKLLAISKNSSGSIEARVHPTMIPENNVLSNVSGSLNAVTISGDAVGDIMLYGHGAGMMPTASAVIGDTVDIARNLVAGTACRVPLMAYQMDSVRQIPILPVSKIVTNYYFRFFAMDRPGVLSKIAGVLGDNNISLRSVHQKGRNSDSSVPIVMLTHRACEADVQNAMNEISKLEIIEPPPMLIRIENEDPKG